MFTNNEIRGRFGGSSSLLLRTTPITPDRFRTGFDTWCSCSSYRFLYQWRSWREQRSRAQSSRSSYGAIHCTWMTFERVRFTSTDEQNVGTVATRRQPSMINTDIPRQLNRQRSLNPEGLVVSRLATIDSLGHEYSPQRRYRHIESPWSITVGDSDKSSNWVSSLADLVRKSKDQQARCGCPLYV